MTHKTDPLAILLECLETKDLSNVARKYGVSLDKLAHLLAQIQQLAQDILDGDASPSEKPIQGFNKQLAFVNHLIMTPLSNIELPLELLLQRPGKMLEKERHRLLMMILRNAKTLEIRWDTLMEKIAVEKDHLTFTLSLGEIKRLERLNWVDEKPTKEMPEEAKTEPLASGIPLLVGEDDRAFASIVSEVLTREGFHVMVVYDGKQVQQVIQDTRPPIIILDALLPKMSGFDLCKYAKTVDPDNYQPKVLMMTAVYKQYSYQMKALHHYKLDAFLIKPFQLNVLVEKVKEFVPTDKETIKA